MSQKKKNEDLTSNDRALIKETEQSMSKLLERFEEAKQFTKGDFLLLYQQNSYGLSADPVPATNSYGAIRKWKVIHVDSLGIPYCKEVNSKGNLQGHLVSCMQTDNNRNRNSGFFNQLSCDQFFSVDPSYAEAIILGEEDAYDPTQINRNLSNIFKEIVEFNKSVKVNTSDKRQLEKFLSTVRVGTSFWASAQTQHVVQEIHPVPKDRAGRIHTEMLFMTTVNTKGKTIQWAWWNIYGKNVYTTRPRSNQELKI